MISSRVSLSRDYYAAGVATLTSSAAKVLFYPMNAPKAWPITPPTAEDGISVPSDVLPCIVADRVLVSNPSTHAIVVRPVIPGSPEAIEYPYPKYAGASGATGAASDYSGYSLTNLAAAPADNSHGITVPAGAIAFPIEIVCVGLVMSGTSADTLAYAAYGSAKRA